MIHFKKHKNPLLVILTIMLLSVASDIHGQLISNLPIIEIRSQEPIIDEEKVDASFFLYYRPHADTQSTLDKPALQHAIQIEYRGRSSLNFPKKGMGFEFVDEEGKNTAVSLLDFPSASEWVIHSPYSDKSLIRNVLAYSLAGDIMTYAPRYQLAEMVLNGRYYGVVVLTEKIEIGPGRIDIAPPSKEVGSSIILKFDKGKANEEVWQSRIIERPYENPIASILAHQPDSEDLTFAQVKDIRLFLDRIDDVMALPTFDHPDAGWRRFFDEKSLIDHFLLTELSKDVDAYRISTYFYRKKSQNILFMGPLWDFNIAYGNAYYCEAANPEGWAWEFNIHCGDSDGSGSNHVHFWFPRFIQDSAFLKKMHLRWQDLRDDILNTENIHALIDRKAALLSEAQHRNFERWPILGKTIWPNHFVGDSYSEEIDYLKDWIEHRANWMDSALAKMNIPVTNPYVYTRIYPNPAKNMVHIEVVNSQGNGPVRFEIYNTTGEKVHDSGQLIPTDDFVSYQWETEGSGMYLVRVYLMGEFYRMFKFVVG